MTTIIAYDALGGGLETTSGNFIESAGTGLTVTYSESTYWDFNTDRYYVEYDYGDVYGYFYINSLGGSNYEIETFFLYDLYGQDLIDVYNLDLNFDANDDFSGDVLFTNMFAGNDNVTGNNFGDILYLGAGTDVGRGKNGNDRIYGESGNDKIYGDANNDVLNGGSGNDYVSGGSGNDTLYTSTGYDTLVGGTGMDKLYGGTDSYKDIFDFNSRFESAVGSNRDVIYNFTRGVDDIDLRSIDARGSTSTNDVFKYGGKTATSYGVWWANSSAGVIVKADVTGDKVADFEIRLSGVTSVSSGDFLL